MARFAHAPIGRLIKLHAAILLLAVACFGSFLGGLVFPSIREAISRLPAKSSIEDGVLKWPGPVPARLAENRFLSIVANPEGARESSSADLQLELQKSQVRISSLFGYWDIPYFPGYTIALNSSELQPLWGAWSPLLMAGTLLLFAIFLELSWLFFATIYFWIPRILAFYLDKPLSSFEAWKLSAAALVPGAVLMSAGIFLYAHARLSLVTLLIIAGAHLLAAWPYLLGSPLFLKGNRKVENPFGEGQS